MHDVVAGNRAAGEAAELPLAVVIPLFNEERIIADNLETLAGIFDELVGAGGWFFILVDNGSTDQTPERVAQAVARWPLSRGIRLRQPNYGAALKAGLQEVAAKWAFTLDIEQWDIPFIRWAWRNRNSFDAFIASKRADPTINHQQPYRKLLSCGLNGLLQILVQFSGTDTHGCKLLNCAALRPIIGLCQLDRGQFDTELVLRAIRSRKRLVEAPMEYREFRPHRNWMVKKVFWNLLALRRLVRVMREVPFEGPIRYYRFARDDLLREDGAARAAAEEYDLV
jgi:glycosyltransferase involved in cell wall biosynthesis